MGWLYESIKKRHREGGSRGGSERTRPGLQGVDQQGTRGWHTWHTEAKSSAVSR